MSYEEIHEDGEYRVVLEYDTDPSEWTNPRYEAVNLGVMWCSHPRYNLGDWQNPGPEHEDLTDFIREMQEWHGGQALTEAIVKHLKRAGATYVAPLYLLDHSGLSISHGGNLIRNLYEPRRAGVFISDPQGWDTSYVGFIFDTPRTREECGTPLERVAEAIDGEVSTYSSYLEGDIWQYRIEKKVTYHLTKTDAEGNTILDEDGWDWEHVDGCGGFLGSEYAEREALADLKAHAHPEPVT